MTTPDMDVIKEIPGYKVILKAILKTQIQQLVEQLASTTDEESVILTASVSDGTLSHLGSDSGKGFLEDHEDIKSQFLGFCLKRHHKKKQVEKEKQEAALRSPPPVPTHFGQGPGPRMGYGPGRMPRMPYPRGGLRGGPGPIRSQMGRHEPYPMARPPRRTSFESPDMGGNTQQFMNMPPMGGMNPNLNRSDINNPVNIKTEAVELSDDSNQGSTQLHSSSHPSPSQGGIPDADGERSNSSSSTIPNDPADLANIKGESGANNDSFNTDLNASIDGDTSVQRTASGAMDPNVNVKIEAITESEMELEITGVEPGRLPNINAVQDQSWGSDGQGGMMTFDPSGGATGSPDDMQGYNDQMMIPYQTQSDLILGNAQQRKKSNNESHQCEV